MPQQQEVTIHPGLVTQREVTTCIDFLEPFVSTRAGKSTAMFLFREPAFQVFPSRKLQAPPTQMLALLDLLVLVRNLVLEACKQAFNSYGGVLIYARNCVQVIGD